MILLVEDEAITRNAFADALRREGHQVVQAADGVQALSLVDNCRVDLVITDLVMPRLNGFELIGQIRSKRSHVPSSSFPRTSRRRQEALFQVEAPSFCISLSIRLLPNLH